MKQNKLSSIVLAVIAIWCAFSVTPIHSQEAMSPYSRFGYGLLNDNATSAQRQMGGVGYAMNSGRQINVMNPASYAAIDTLTFLFDMGLDFTTLLSNDRGESIRQFGGGLDYATMQFPIGKFMGASIGLLPYSSIGYSFGSDITNGADSRSGYGGLNQLYAGLAARPFKGFSLGVNFSYLFGDAVNDTYVLSDQSSSLFEQHIEVRDWHLQVGLQYNFAVGHKNRVSLGAVYSPGKTLLGRASVIKYDVSSNETPDTVANTRLKNHFSLPDTWGGGIGWHWDDRLDIEADFTYQPWSKAKFDRQVTIIENQFSDRWQAALGAQFTPDPRGKYFGRVTYRIGGFFNHDYMKVGDNSVREYGVSCGFGLPTMSLKTIVNLGFEWRHRQAHPNPMLKENYFNVTLGINFCELWFFQNKIR